MWLNSYRNFGWGVVRVLLPVFFLVIYLFLLPVQVFAANSQVISGTIYEDLNLNNTLDYGEQVLNGWQVNLYQNETLLKTTLSSASGRYVFTDLAPRDYLIEVVLSPGWVSMVGSRTYVVASQDRTANFAAYNYLQKTPGIGPIMQLHNFNVELISPTAAKISWFTSHPATSQVVYGTNQIADNSLNSSAINLGYLSQSRVELSAQTYHEVILSNLKPATTYYFRSVSLANPKQWRGAGVLFGPELIFTTESLPPQPQPQPIEPQTPTSPPEIFKPQIISLTVKKPEGKVLATQNEEELRVIEPTSTPEVVVEGAATTPESKVPAAGCDTVLWLLLIINFIVVGFVRYYSRISESSFDQKVWWLDSLVILLPFIMVYPDCRLVWWLILTFIISIYLFSYLKKNFEKSLQISTLGPRISTLGPSLTPPPPAEDKAPVQHQLNLDDEKLNLSDKEKSG